MKLKPSQRGRSFNGEIHRTGVPRSSFFFEGPADQVFERVEEAVNNALRPLCNELQSELKKRWTKAKEKENT